MGDHCRPAFPVFGHLVTVGQDGFVATISIVSEYRRRSENHIQTYLALPAVEMKPSESRRHLGTARLKVQQRKDEEEKAVALARMGQET